MTTDPQLPLESVTDLDRALHILARVHTRDNREVGFVVQMDAMPHDACVTHTEYADAWRVVRMHLYLNVNPEPTPNPEPFR